MGSDRASLRLRLRLLATFVLLALFLSHALCFIHCHAPASVSGDSSTAQIFLGADRPMLGVKAPSCCRNGVPSHFPATDGEAPNSSAPSQCASLNLLMTSKPPLVAVAPIQSEALPLLVCVLALAADKTDVELIPTPHPSLIPDLTPIMKLGPAHLGLPPPVSA